MAIRAICSRGKKKDGGPRGSPPVLVLACIPRIAQKDRESGIRSAKPLPPPENRIVRPVAVLARGVPDRGGSVVPSVHVKQHPLPTRHERTYLMIYLKSDNLMDQIALIQELHMPAASVTDVARNFAEYLNRVAYRGERFTLMRGGKPVAELVPVTSSLPRGVPIEDLPRIFASLPKLSDEEWVSFAADVEAGRPTASEDDFRDPWES